MRYRFGPYELDVERFELRKSGAAIAAEPQVVSLLLFLVANRDRLVTKDEIIGAVWGGRCISDSALSSRIKSARRLVDDNGSAQRVVHTVHGRGFRFVAEVEEVATHVDVATVRDEPRIDPVRPSIAVLPLSVVGDAGVHAIIAEALPHEIIRELARLRWLFVIARGSSFRFAGLEPDLSNAAETLGVRYVLTGTLESVGCRIAVAIELMDARDQGVVWAEHFEVSIEAMPELRNDIVASVVSALEIHIPLQEAARARLALPGCLDAWSAYHLGLQRMFRFNAADNAVATELFSRAVAQEPSFARAHAGLSFTYFQNAFLGYADAGSATARAREAAERAVALDPLDPFANAVMGRAHWLSDDLGGSLAWLERSTALSPNYAQGTYARAWAQTLLGRGEDGQRHADRAMALSPIDPLRYAMLATRALSHLVRGEDEEAAVWAERAAHEPGAHALIAVIAAACHAASGNPTKARAWVEVVHKRQPTTTRDRFFRSFPFADLTVRSRIERALKKSGL